MKLITLAMLEEHNACAEGKKRFADTFPKGMRVTYANVRHARKVGLPVDWAAYNLLPGRLFDIFCDICNKRYEFYSEVQDVACKKYYADRAAAWKACDKENKTALEEFDKYRASIWLTYSEAIRAPWELYIKQCDVALVECFNM